MMQPAVNWFSNSLGPPLKTSRSATGQTSVHPRQDLLQVCKELRPAGFGALVGLLLIRPEARLLHAQMGPRARRGESPSDDTLETIGRPGERQRSALAWTCRNAPTARRLKRWSTTGLKSFFMSHASISCGCVTPPDLFRRSSSRISRFTTESVSADVSTLAESVSDVDGFQMQVGDPFIVECGRPAPCSAVRDRFKALTKTMTGC